ncbi:PAS domain S-box-containing protein [Luteimonas cucumeris]|uniref:histidine kinase n=2 Tax=Luteimonas cucumeris TaxID=985012 RepID=A0A562KVR3_9GAMM|nr:PAS domain S-box-containing protein [Luteimonas cucumeris]
MASSGIGMAIVDLDGRWAEVNPALERIFGCPASELVGRYVLDCTHPDDREDSQHCLSGLMDGSLPVTDSQRRYLRSDGSIVWTHVNVAAMRDARGRTIYLIAQLRDISAQHHAEMALQELNRTLEQRVAERTDALLVANLQLQQFAYGVSHDLRGPLRAIEGFSAQLQRQCRAAMDEAGRDYLQRIRDNASRMSALIDGLLELSRATSADMRPQSVDLSLLLEWVGAELQDAEPGRDARIDVQPDLRVHGDERLMKSLFTQLLGNAWKFSARREKTVIEVRGTTEAGGLRVSIHDQGCGYATIYADKLFEPFQRLHGQAEGGGSGLGLAIAQRIARRHGGRIWAESTPGVGSIFHVWLPVSGNDEGAEA